MSWDEALHPRGHGGKFARHADAVAVTAEHANGLKPRRVVRTRAGARHFRTPLGQELGAYRRPRFESIGGATWGASHGGSFALSGASAEIMGVPGYRHHSGNDWMTGTYRQRMTYARNMLRGIRDSRPSDTPLHHGTSDSRWADVHPGDTVDLPLTATSGDPSLAESYSHREGRQGYVVHFPAGTRHLGYSVNEAYGNPEFEWEDDPSSFDRHLWDEAIVAGRYRVHDRHTDAEGVTHLHLHPTHVFNPDTRRMEPTT